MLLLIELLCRDVQLDTESFALEPIKIKVDGWSKDMKMLAEIAKTQAQAAYC